MGAVTYYYSTYHNILCTIQLLNSPSKRSSYFETMFWQQATKATTVNSPCLTYFFLNFSWFNKQLGNEKHNYSTSMYPEVLLLRRLLLISGHPQNLEAQKRGQREKKEIIYYYWHPQIWKTNYIWLWSKDLRSFRNREQKWWEIKDHFKMPSKRGTCK